MKMWNLKGRLLLRTVLHSRPVQKTFLWAEICSMAQDLPLMPLPAEEKALSQSIDLCSLILHLLLAVILTSSLNLIRMIFLSGIMTMWAVRWQLMKRVLMPSCHLEIPRRYLLRNRSKKRPHAVLDVVLRSLILTSVWAADFAQQDVNLMRSHLPETIRMLQP